MKKQRYFVAIMVIGMFLLGMNLTGVRADQYDDAIAAGKLVMGSDIPYAPFEYEAENGSYIGFDVSIASAIAEDMGITLEVKPVIWDSIIPSLKAKEFDVLLSSMTITDERAEEIDFSCPYYNSSQAILVGTGNPLGIVTVTDLDNATMVIGVQTGTTSDLYATENFPLATITRSPEFVNLYLALENDDINVILGDLPVVAYAASTGEVSGEVVGSFGSAELFGIGIRKGETKLYDAVNDALTTMYSNGDYAKIYKMWFGIDPDLTKCEGGKRSAEESSPGFEWMVPIVVLLPLALGTMVIRRRK
ncbi:MAG: transporter substrate-binding domain-containing protein [Candidatus Hodarchaeales archaeon]|jgi:ABC-type amino acid transport substrate-binding protein